MSAFWLHNVGVAISFGALASKIYRVHRILALGGGLQRRQLGVKDAIAPLYLSLAIFVSLLLLLTFVDPLRYERVYNEGYDRFGRLTSSYGTCRASGTLGNSLASGSGAASDGGAQSDSGLPMLQSEVVPRRLQRRKDSFCGCACHAGDAFDWHANNIEYRDSANRSIFVVGLLDFCDLDCCPWKHNAPVKIEPLVL